MKRLTLLMVLLSMLTTHSISAQGKAKVIIKKNIDGVESTIEKEVEVSELESFLEEEGVDMEFQFDEDAERVIEIHIEKEDMDDAHTFAYNYMDTKPFLGVTPSEEESDRGVRIGSVIEGSAAEKAGLRSGDVILELNEESVTTFEDVKDIVWSASPGAEMMIRYERDGKKMKSTAVLGEHKRDRMHRKHPSAMDWDFRWDGEDLDELRSKLDEQLSKLEGIEFDFDFDREEFMDVMEDVKTRLGEGMDRMQFDFDMNTEEDGNIFEFHHPQSRSETVVIIMEEISEEEANTVNSQASPKLRTDNSLKLNDLRYFPNPGNGLFELQFNAPDAGDLEVIIFDSQGKKVYYEMLADFSGAYSNHIDISQRLSGNYFIQIAQNGKTYSRKLIKE